MHDPGVVNDAVRGAILAVVGPRLARAGIGDAELDRIDLVAEGILDSLDVMNLIDEVEAMVPERFSWDLFSADYGMTMPALAAAFQPQAAAEGRPMA